MLDRKFLRNVPLPFGLKPDEIFDALQATQDFFMMIRVDAEIVLSSIIQSNNFSGVVSNVFTKKLDDYSQYKSFHDQRYPDLKHITTGEGLEVKASNRPMKGGEGHNGHSGWHIIVCFELQEDGDIEFVQVEVANLQGYECADSDWHYQGSKRNDNQSQRTETYTTTAVGTYKLRDGSVYLNNEKISITSRMRKMRYAINDVLPVPAYSPFYSE